MSLTLYYYPDNASLAPHICLRKAGADFQLSLVERNRGGLTDPAYLALNPHARVPTLAVGDPSADGFVIRESAAICQYVAETYPASGLLPQIGTTARALTIDWLTFSTNTIQADLMVSAYARRYAETSEQITAVKSRAADRVGGHLAIVDRELAKSGDWLVGNSPTCADIFLFMLAGWAEQFKIPDPPSVRPNLLAHARRCQELPEVIDTFEAEGISFFFR
ncbi:MAG: glutathione S-transferase family protein [Alphaproteobacteria bacterium]|nr:glutathione S-transferase family protein [Alphaproteobacteria bacterium]